MPRLPAICDNAECRTVFSSGYNITGGSADVAGNKSGPCPRCGSDGTVPDGLYEILGDTIRVVATSAKSADSLRRLENLLQETAQGGSASSFASSLRHDLPEFGALAREAEKRRNWKEFREWMLCVAAVVTVLLTAYSTFRPHEGELTRDVVDQIFERVLDRQLQLLPPAQVPPVDVEDRRVKDPN
jgi:hypothetical protein